MKPRPLPAAPPKAVPTVIPIVNAPVLVPEDVMVPLLPLKTETEMVEEMETETTTNLPEMMMEITVEPRLEDVPVVLASRTEDHTVEDTRMVQVLRVEEAITL